MNLAILGAGMLGSCLALEMAQRGVRVALYDREAACITQAGARNEGKIHLGFVYGADPTFQTADLMLAGGMKFYPLLRKWIGNEIDSVAVSTPFVYVIEKGSLLSVSECERHFRRVDERLIDLPSSDYPGGLFPRVEKMSDKECNRLFNAKKVAAAYRTAEKSVDVRKIAGIIRKKVQESPLIAFHPQSEVTGVSILGDQVELCINGHFRSYDVAVNTLWDGRLALDAKVGLLDEAPWSYRLKHGIFLKSSAVAGIPSTTIIQGPYGDFVDYGHGNCYLSWYPAGMLGFAKNTIHPPQWNRNLDKKEVEQLAVDSIAGLAEYIPGMSQICLENSQNLSVVGGVIYAHGETDVDDPKSGLHNRYELKIKSKGNYYSVNPGKYTLCPYFADQAARQICSTAAVSACV